MKTSNYVLFFVFTSTIMCMADVNLDEQLTMEDFNGIRKNTKTGSRSIIIVNKNNVQSSDNALVDKNSVEEDRDLSTRDCIRSMANSQFGRFNDKCKCGLSYCGDDDRKHWHFCIEGSSPTCIQRCTLHMGYDDTRADLPINGFDCKCGYTNTCPAADYCLRNPGGRSGPQSQKNEKICRPKCTTDNFNKNKKSCKCGTELYCTSNQYCMTGNVCSSRGKCVLNNNDVVKKDCKCGSSNCVKNRDYCLTGYTCKRNCSPNNSIVVTTDCKCGTNICKAITHYCLDGNTCKRKCTNADNGIDPDCKCSSNSCISNEYCVNGMCSSYPKCGLDGTKQNGKDCKCGNTNLCQSNYYCLRGTVCSESVDKAKCQCTGEKNGGQNGASCDSEDRSGNKWCYVDGDLPDCIKNYEPTKSGSRHYSYKICTKCVVDDTNKIGKVCRCGNTNSCTSNQYCLSGNVCSSSPAPINGKYTEFGACSVTCGVGSKHRTCTNPPPKHGGANCAKFGTESQTCIKQPCPVDGRYTEFGPCSVTCGVGSKHRTCTNPSPQYGGNNCNGLGLPSESCTQNPCPINGRYTEFGPCSVTCSKHRTCTNPSPQYGGNNCKGASSESCTQNPCPTEEEDDNETNPRARQSKSSNAFSLNIQTAVLIGIVNFVY